MAGICLRGKPGWGDLGAAFTTVLNTFGGTWWSAKSNGQPDKAQVDQPAFKQALDFYAKLVQDAGEKDAANSSFNECLTQYQANKVAMWYDATVAAGTLEAADSPVKGKNGYAFAPVYKTKSSGWLWSWALAIPRSSPDPTDAWTYIAWATGPQYIKAAGTHTKGGWAAIPPGTRFSTYRIPQYKAAAKAFAATTLAAMKAAPITNPGTSKRPGLPGVQYVGIPQFQDVGNRCTQLFSAVIAGSMDDTKAISQCQQIAAQAVKEASLFRLSRRRHAGEGTNRRPLLVGVASAASLAARAALCRRHHAAAVPRKHLLQPHQPQRQDAVADPGADEIRRLRQLQADLQRLVLPS